MGMRPARVSMTGIFDSPDPRAAKVSIEMLRSLVTGLALADYAYLKANPQTPKLYESGVRYVAEPGTENWLTVPELMKTKQGDCEDLAGWRAAEYWLKGIPARPDVRARLVNGVWRAHAFVRLPDRRIDDPSIKLGMKGID